MKNITYFNTTYNTLMISIHENVIKQFTILNAFLDPFWIFIPIKSTNSRSRDCGCTEP